VDDYDEVVRGRRVKMQDRWTEITAGSHTLTELHETGGGAMKPYVVSHDTRESDDRIRGGNGGNSSTDRPAPQGRETE
jgi:hypothetical protein